MPRFSLRTLIVVMLLGGPACAWGWWMAKNAPGLAIWAGLGIAIVSAVIVVMTYEEPDSGKAR